MLRNFSYPSNSLMMLFSNGIYKSIIYVTDYKSDSVMNITTVTSLTNAE